MATYKLIQDIEAEDHILGPLSLRQFIFALVGAFGWYLSFVALTKHVYFLLLLFLPPTLFCTFFAIPFGRDQPTEVWALAKLRFWFKPRRRIWDQTGVKELVTITVPKKVERVLTNGLSQTEVHSRLKVLANTLDSRGWAIKNINMNTYAPPNPILEQQSDRLIDIGQVPQEVPSYTVQASDDILDETSNPLAQQFQSMISQSSQQHRQQLINELNSIQPGQGMAQRQAPATGTQWFMNPAPAAATPAPSVTGPALPPPAGMPTRAEAELAALPARRTPTAYAHLRTLQPIGAQGTQPQPEQAAPATNPASQPPSLASLTSAASNPAPSNPTPDPAILSLANNDDLNVSTLAREAYKAKHDDEPPRDEIVVSLR